MDFVGRSFMFITYGSLRVKEIKELYNVGSFEKVEIDR